MSEEELRERVEKLEKVITDMAELMESYQDPESCSTTKLHRYARQLREGLNA